MFGTLQSESGIRCVGVDAAISTMSKAKADLNDFV
jgi:hypothetical protein